MLDEEKIALAEVRGQVYKAIDCLRRATDQLEEETWERCQLTYSATQIRKAKTYLEGCEERMMLRVLEALEKALERGDPEIGMSPGK